MTKFITIAGRKQVGKDTSANLIKALLPNKKVKVIHFADSLKIACSAIFGIPLKDMETEVGKQQLTSIVWPQAYEHGFGDASARRDGVESKANVWVPYTFTGPLSWHHNSTHQGHDILRYMTVREVLQFVGTELFRNQLDPDIWAKSAFRQDYSDYDVVVIADCRFPNEAILGKKYGLLVKIERNTGLASDGHVSEVALDDFQDYDAVITNNGAISALKRKLRNILAEFGIS